MQTFVVIFTFVIIVFVHEKDGNALNCDLTKIIRIECFPISNNLSIYFN